MKIIGSIFTTFLLMASSFAFSQDLSTDKISVDWTADIVLGKGYTVTQTYTVDNYNYVICYNSNTGKTEIWNIEKGGLPIYNRTTHKGWSSLVFFTLNSKSYMFSYKKASGEVLFFEMNSSGIGKRVGEFTWSKDWNGFDVLYQNNEPSIVMTRASDGRAKLFKPHF